MDGGQIDKFFERLSTEELMALADGRATVVPKVVMNGDICHAQSWISYPRERLVALPALYKPHCGHAKRLSDEDCSRLSS